MNANITRKKSSIHENADANITCDFGDGDISRSVSTHTASPTCVRECACEGAHLRRAYICVCVSVRMCVRVCARVCACVCLHVRARVRQHMCMHVSCIRTYIRTCVRAQMRRPLRVCVHERLHAGARI